MREPSPPERILIPCPDGALLHGETLAPPGTPRGTLLLAHAMMASRRTFHRAGMASLLRDAGFLVVTFDFRGHGQTWPLPSEGGDSTYDQHALIDLPAACRWAREHGAGPVALVGHSLGGHAAAASRGLGLLDCDALVLLGGNIWMPRLEPSPWLRARKRAVFEAAWQVTRVKGFFPTRALGLGSEDESRSLFRGFLRWWREDRWCSVDGRTDYLAAARSVRLPALAVAGGGDALECTPDCAHRFLGHLGPGVRDFVVAGHGELAGFAPDHMQLVTHPGSAPAWRLVARWLDKNLPAS